MCRLLIVKRRALTYRTTVRANLTIGTPVIVSPEVHLTVLENIAAWHDTIGHHTVGHLGHSSAVI